MLEYITPVLSTQLPAAAYDSSAFIPLAIRLTIFLRRHGRNRLLSPSLWATFQSLHKNEGSPGG